MTEQEQRQNPENLNTGLFVSEYEEHASALTGYMMRLTNGNMAESDDLVQETFMRAWASRERFQGRSSVKTWLFSIAVNLFRERLRRGKKVVYTDKEADRAADGPGLRTQLVQLEMRDRIEAAVEGLPEELRDPFELVRIQGMSYADAAEILDLSVAAVRMRLHRAHLLLAEILKEYEGAV